MVTDKYDNISNISEEKFTNLRIATALEKICFRLESIEEKMFRKTFKSKLIHFLYLCYPFIIATLLYVINVDQKNISSMMTTSKYIADNVLMLSK